jgi:hypothetical protein
MTNLQRAIANCYSANTNTTPALNNNSLAMSNDLNIMCNARQYNGLWGN